MNIVITWEHIIYGGQVAGAMLALATLGGGTYKYIIRPFMIEKIKEVYHKINDMSEQIATNHVAVSKALPTILKIADELQANHGTSLRDAIDRIENSMENLRATDHLLLNMSDIAHFETDGRGHCLWANMEYCTLTDTPLHEVLGKGWISSIHPEDRDAIVHEWNSAIEDKRPFTSTYRFMTPTGVVKTVRCHAVLNFNRKGQLVGALGSVFPTH